ncbi:MAG: cytidylate kinase-like family protein [Clostridiales Family XIII bacterium]|nr:cytidylate kinase-like family protein [Clostridiales Family XIII bacterium]
MKKVITISREFGSGGRVIGKRVADKMGIKFYDRALIRLIAEESGLAHEFIQSSDESFTAKAPLYFAVGDLYSHMSFAPGSMSLQDQIHMLLGDIIRDIAEKESCVIVGRSADYFLRGRDDCLNVFLHAHKDYKLKRLTETYGMPSNEAERSMEKTDKARANYYKYYSEQIWGQARNYHVSLDSGLLGDELCTDIITELATVL